MNKNLNFHKIKDGGWLDNVICYLKSRYTFISAKDLENNLNNGNSANTCHLTIDDGDISFYNIILPVLRKHSIPATLNVSPEIIKYRSNFWFQEISAFDMSEVKKVICDYAGIPIESIIKNNTISVLKTMQINQIRQIIQRCRKKFPGSGIPFQNITVKQLREIDKTGLVMIGGHTLNHPILKNEEDGKSYSEIRNSIDDLEEILDHEIRYFAYPNGIPGLDFSRREMGYLRSRGIRLAFMNESEDINNRIDPMRVPRIAISDRESLRNIRMKMMFSKIWYSVKKLDPRGEYHERLKLSKMLQSV